jgi:hypothetical protein
MSTEKINETKERIINWLKEEAYSPEETVDPNAFFNIVAKVGNMVCNIAQNVRKRDSIIVGTNLLISSDQLILLKEMSVTKRKEFFWDLRMSLLKNAELGNFEIKPNPPDNISAVFISSKQIFYEDLTKGSLFSAIQAVFRATLMVIWMIQQYAGVTVAKKDHKVPYSA